MIYETLDGRIVDGFRHRMSQRDLDDLELFLAANITVPLRGLEHNPGDHGDPDTVGVRHDVDHNLDHAIRFAEWEKRRGIRASYYLLHSAWYYQEPAHPQAHYGLAAGIDRLQELGHEIGLHSNAVIVARLENPGSPDPVAVLERELDRLRSYGADVTGTAAHGDHRCNEWNVRNTDIWKTTSPQAFGLDYEAYDLNRGRTYISDSHGTWHRAGAPNPHPFGHVIGNPETIVLAHPCHWQPPVPNTPPATPKPEPTPGAPHDGYAGTR